MELDAIKAFLLTWGVYLYLPAAVAVWTIYNTRKLLVYNTRHEQAAAQLSKVLLQTIKRLVARGVFDASDLMEMNIVQVIDQIPEGDDDALGFVESLVSVIKAVT